MFLYISVNVVMYEPLLRSLKEAASHPAHRERYKILFGGLVSVMGKSLRSEMEREETFVKMCNSIADMVKNAKGDNKVCKYVV